jgi:LuxR family maltose regulon positive regulatory protein
LLATGKSNAEIADDLAVSRNTVKTHLCHLYGKLAVTSRTQAIVRAHELHLSWRRDSPDRVTDIASGDDDRA